jgi:hypothetical protein
MLSVLRRLLIIAAACLLLAGASLLVPDVRSFARSAVKSVVRPEPPAPITPIAMVQLSTAAPTLTPTSTSTSVPPSPTPSLPVATAVPTGAPIATPLPPIATPLPPTATPLPPTATPGPVEVNGRLYDAYIPAANKEGQRYQYSCEFDAAWVIVQTYGIDASVDDLIGVMPMAGGNEPFIEETAQGFLIHGGDITSTFAGDYTSNFLARSTGDAVSQVFAEYGLHSESVRDRAGIEAALRAGHLVWMKTTVDFKPWRPATWVMPDGRTHQTVLGNDHAVVVIGYNANVVVIRDVLGPTSSNWQRPYEYEVDWPTFLAAWGAQSFDGLAVMRPAASQ